MQSVNLTSYTMNETIKNIFKETVQCYNQILSKYYPAHKSNGFTERNLTFNFSSCYRKAYPKSIIWQEACLAGREHIDTLVIDEENKAVILIEAKRLQGENKKESLLRDYERITNKDININGLADINSEDYSLYALMIFDVWVSKKTNEKDNRYKRLHEILPKGETNYVEEVSFNKDWDMKETYHLAYILKKLK